MIADVRAADPAGATVDNELCCIQDARLCVDLARNFAQAKANETREQLPHLTLMGLSPRKDDEACQERQNTGSGLLVPGRQVRRQELLGVARFESPLAKEDHWVACQTGGLKMQTPPVFIDSQAPGWLLLCAADALHDSPELPTQAIQAVMARMVPTLP